MKESRSSESSLEQEFATNAARYLTLESVLKAIGMKLVD
jgi:hypothetical protein